MYVKEKYISIVNNLLSIYNKQEAENIVKILLQKRLQINSISIYADKIIEQPILEQLLADEIQLLQHKPIQYIVEEAWFYKYPFYVNENVLIPRPETELLVESCLKQAKKINGEINIIDIGTGSGCIAISLKKELLNANITAVDISNQALTIAKKNALDLNVKVNFIEANILDENIFSNLPKANIIISNPPYIPLQQKETMHTNVLQYEPHQALFVPNKDPLIFYKKLAELCVAKKAMLCCEISEFFGDATKQLLQQYFVKVTLYKDYEDKDRYIVASF